MLLITMLDICWIRCTTKLRVKCVGREMGNSNGAAVQTQLASGLCLHVTEVSFAISALSCLKYMIVFVFS